MHNTPGWMTALFVGLTLVGVLVVWLTAKPPEGPNRDDDDDPPIPKSRRQ